MRKAAICSVLTLLLALLSVEGSSQDFGTNPPRFRIKPIPTGTVSNSNAFSISPNGDYVVGDFHTTTSSNPVAYVWNVFGDFEQLAIPSSGFPGTIDYCSAIGVNNAKEIVGECLHFEFGIRFGWGSVWRKGIPSALPNVRTGVQRHTATLINNDDVIAGVSPGSRYNYPVLFSPTPITIASPASNLCFIYPRDINDSGRIVGSGKWAGFCDGGIGTLPGRGMVYDVGDPTFVSIETHPDFPNRANSDLTGINNSGDAVGRIYAIHDISPLTTPSNLPVRWNEKSGWGMIPLPPGREAAKAWDINNFGIIVGEINTIDGGLGPGDERTGRLGGFISDGTTSFDLMDLIDNPSGWTSIIQALRISDNNRILGRGVNSLDQTVPFILIPQVPVSGRVLMTNGRAISRAQVTITGGDLSEPRVGMTNSFGYFRVYGLDNGGTYTVTVSSRKYSFSPAQQTVVANGLTNIFFTGE